MSLSDTNQDRRQFKRRALRVRAQLTLNLNLVFEVRTIDISQGGMAISAHASPQAGTRMAIRFGLPSQAGGITLVDLQAEVVNSVLMTGADGFKIGLRFIDPSKESSDVISEYINRIYDNIVL